MPTVKMPDGQLVDMPPLDQLTAAQRQGLAKKGAFDTHDDEELDRHPIVSGVGETLAHLGSQAAAFPVEGAASIFHLALDPTGQKMKGARQATQDVQEAMVYQPRGRVGKAVSKAVDTAVSYPARKLEDLGTKVGVASGSPALGAAVAVVPQAAAVVFGGEAASIARKAFGRAGKTDIDAAQTAEAYVHANVPGLDWGKLSDAFKVKLTTIAKDQQALNRLDPKAVERVGRAQSLGLPITRGQATRNLSDITSEENIQRSEAGQPLRDIQSQQDVGLHAQLDKLREATGAKAETRQQVGTSVQGTLRSKLRDTKARAGQAYDLANQLGENETTRTEALDTFLEHPINEANVGWVRSRLEKLRNPDGTISLKNLEDVRQELTRAARIPDKGGHYASEATQVIDRIMDDAGSTAYRNARAGWKGMKDEFDKQGRVKKLVTEKGMSSDRATALEDTWDATVRKGSAEDLQKVQKSLTTGADPQLVARGRQAWKDLQGATVDYLKEKAAGRRAIPGEKTQLPFNSSFLDAFDELDKDGKLSVLFPEHQAELAQLRQATLDLRTKPADRIAGPNTTPRLVALLEKLAKVPGLGDVGRGVVRGVSKLHQMGREGREAREATQTPLDTAIPAPPRRRYTIGELGPVVPTAAQDRTQQP